jgi:L-ectoine synthase
VLIKKLEDIRRSNRSVSDKGWESSRLLLAEDGMGFSMHVTTLQGGGEWQFHYQYHLEAVLIVQGSGSIEDLTTGERHALAPGTLYALNDHDRHVLRAETELVAVCVFNPPVTGDEVHDETGAYRPAAPVAG